MALFLGEPKKPHLVSQTCGKVAKYLHFLKVLDTKEREATTDSEHCRHCQEVSIDKGNLSKYA